MRPWALVLAMATAAPGLAAAEEPSGCAAFRWPIESERVALNAPTKPSVPNGGSLLYGAALTLTLASFADAALPHPPERTPKATPSFAGHFTLPAPAAPGLYKVTLASNGWVDVVDNGAYLHPKSSSGALGCEGARKSVAFELPGHPVDIQVSDVRAPAIGVMITPFK